MQAARDDDRQIAPFSAAYDGFDIQTAYQVAGVMHRTRLARGDVAVGRKIGFTNPDMWPLFGVQAPVWGYVYKSTVVQLAQASHVCSLASFFEPKIEPEITLHFDKTPPAGAHAQEILECLDWIAHGIEIVQCLFPGWQFKAPDTIADLALHATLLVGEPAVVRDLGRDLPTQLEQFSVELLCNGTLREKARGSNVLGSPLHAMAHLTKVLATQPDALPIQAGEIVTTGTITKAYSIQAGETWKTTIQGIRLPGLTVEFTS